MALTRTARCRRSSPRRPAPTPPRAPPNGSPPSSPGGGPGRRRRCRQGDELDAERLRVAAALVAKEAAKLEATLACLGAARGEVEAAVAAEAIVTGTVLGSYRFDGYRAADPEEPAPARIESLTLVGPAEAAEAAAASPGSSPTPPTGPATCSARRPTSPRPTCLGERAEEIAAGPDSVTVEILGPAAIREKRMGGLARRQPGRPEEPRLIALRYSGGGSGPTLGFVGKGVTFDTGGISLKPGAGMQEMKYDMSGGAAVLEAVAAIAELGLASTSSPSSPRPRTCPPAPRSSPAT